MTSFMRSLKNVRETPGDISKTLFFMVFFRIVHLRREDQMTSLQLSTFQIHYQQQWFIYLDQTQADVITVMQCFISIYRVNILETMVALFKLCFNKK